MMVKHGFQGFLFIVCINKDVRSSDKRGVWQLFSIQAAIKGDSPFSALFSPFWSTNKQKSDCNGENGDENSENRDQNGESVGRWGCGRDVGARRTQGLVPHSSASERLCATQLCAGGESSLGV
jgi:hypothetical protein